MRYCYVQVPHTRRHCRHSHYPHPKPQWYIRHNPPRAKAAAIHYRIVALVYAVHYTYKQGSSQYLAQATFVASSTGIENSDKGKSLAPCGNLLPPTHSLMHSLPITPHIVRQRGVPVAFELTSAPNSSLTEAIYRTYSDTKKGRFSVGRCRAVGGSFQTEEREKSLFKPLNA